MLNFVVVVVGVGVGGGGGGGVVVVAAAAAGGGVVVFVVVVVVFSLYACVGGQKFSPLAACKQSVDPIFPHNTVGFKEKEPGVFPAAICRVMAPLGLAVGNVVALRYRRYWSY